MKNKVPEIKLIDGYPSSEFLGFIQKYIPDEDLPISRFLEILKEVWWSPEFGFKIEVDEEKEVSLILHTGGWSGNESIINTMLENMYLTYGAMQYYQWNVGGHYRFKVKDDDYLTN